jgi:hypothetical protein
MARAAKEGLDGADIYSGCCTLKIEYAKVSFSNSTHLDFFFFFSSLLFFSSPLTQHSSPFPKRNL